MLADVKNWPILAKLALLDCRWDFDPNLRKFSLATKVFSQHVKRSETLANTYARTTIISGIPERSPRRHLSPPDSKLGGDLRYLCPCLGQRFIFQWAHVHPFWSFSSALSLLSLSANIWTTEMTSTQVTLICRKILSFLLTILLYHNFTLPFV